MQGIEHTTCAIKRTKQQMLYIQVHVHWIHVEKNTKNYTYGLKLNKGNWNGKGNNTCKLVHVQKKYVYIKWTRSNCMCRTKLQKGVKTKSMKTYLQCAY